MPWNSWRILEGSTTIRSGAAAAARSAMTTEHKIREIIPII
jgi:hypothetical protein